MVLRPEDLRALTTFRKTLCRVFDDPTQEIRIDHRLRETMVACAITARPGQHGTRITEDVIQAYTSLHRRGYAHSTEVWYAGECAGGLYGVVPDRMSYSEPVSAHRTDASKIALAALCALLGGQDVAMTDYQQETEHLVPPGGAPVPRAAFLVYVRETANAPAIVSWHFDKLAFRRWTVRNEQA